VIAGGAFNTANVTKRELEKIGSLTVIWTRTSVVVSSL